tara:strand:+ start:6518 stop:7210 length:693 start_codon:yes stop_codon:yes gene_type:complete
MDEKTDIILADNNIEICEIRNDTEFIEDNFNSDDFAIKRCCYHQYPLHNFDIIVDKINSLQIDSKDKKLVLFRLQRIFTKVSCLQKIYKYSYFYSRVFIVVASILAPTLTSINTDKKNSMYIYLWWMIWNLQILISLLTSVSTFFKWDRNYFLYSEFKDKIEEEIWHFLQSTHEYKNESDIINSHQINTNNLPTFIQKVEEMYTNLCLKDAEIKLSNLQFTKNEQKQPKL